MKNMTAKPRDKKVRHLIFNDLNVMAKGKFSESHTLGFSIYSLETKAFLFMVYGATSKAHLEKYLKAKLCN